MEKHTIKAFFFVFFSLLLSSCWVEDTLIPGTVGPVFEVCFDFDGKWVKCPTGTYPIKFDSYSIDEDELVMSGRMAFNDDERYDTAEKVDENLCEITRVNLSASREYDSLGRSDYVIKNGNPRWEILEQFEDCEYSFNLRLNIYGLDSNVDNFGTLRIGDPFRVTHIFNE